MFARVTAFIQERTRQSFQLRLSFKINPDECIDCDACIPVCPVSAIFPIEDLPNNWKRFAEANANWYALKETK